MTTVLNGLVGGLVAAAVIAGVAAGVGHGPSLAATAIASARGGDHSRYRWPGLGLSLVAGSLAGGLLVAIELSVLGVLAVPPARTTALLVGVGWGLVVFLVTAAGLTALGIDHRRLGRLLVAHVGYGVLLGTWIRLTWIT